jgi:molybdopterin synthase catalytic subunit
VKIKIIAAEFDPWQEIQDHQKTLTLAGKFGATCVFIGSMRDFNDGDDIKALELEHYPGMTEHQLGQCVAEAEQQ